MRSTASKLRFCSKLQAMYKRYKLSLLALLGDKAGKNMHDFGDPQIVRLLEVGHRKYEIHEKPKLWGFSSIIPLGRSLLDVG